MAVHDMEFARHSLPDPRPLRDIQPTLRLHTRSAVSHTAEFYDLPETVARSWADRRFLATNRLVFITHGFRHSSQSKWIVKATKLMLEEQNQTVATLDWAGCAEFQLWKYGIAAANTEVVAKWLSEYLVEIRKLCPDLYIWGVGHSLGAHIVGMAGRESGVFRRITGLDPAGPAFELANLDKRLRPTDAPMVDVIHTDGLDVRWIKSHTPINHYGTLIPLGTHDFYPNFGTSRQPGATFMKNSHARCVELFVWSINHPGRFLTRRVLVGEPGYGHAIYRTSEVLEEYELGYYADRNPPNPDRNLFYLATNAAEPWVPLVAAAAGGNDKRL